MSFETPIRAPGRMLLIRLDRLGDVVLSAPAAYAMRRHLPHAFIAMLVSPACREVIEGHPALNEVISYDKDGAERTARGTLRFARRLRAYEFDTALVLHPSNRSHVIPWLAGIPVRVGYDRNLPALLTHRIPHRKQEGTMHETAYVLEMLEAFGIPAGTPKLFVPVPAEAQRRVEQLLAEAGVSPSDTLVAVHPSASCVSKRWMPERFAQVADRLIERHGAKVCLITGGPELFYARAVERAMRGPSLNLGGKLTIGQLGALLRRAALLISNDSGPVHVAAAVGTPVVDIFGRNQRGVSPQRWRPLGPGHAILHKEVGCVTCLAHDCDIGFQCLTAITVEEVYAAADAVLALRGAPRLTSPAVPD
jgi:heptosyltransferase-2